MIMPLWRHCAEHDMSCTNQRHRHDTKPDVANSIESVLNQLMRSVKDQLHADIILFWIYCMHDHQCLPDSSPRCVNRSDVRSAILSSIAWLTLARAVATQLPRCRSLVAALTIMLVSLEGDFPYCHLHSNIIARFSTMFCT